VRWLRCPFRPSTFGCDWIHCISLYKEARVAESELDESGEMVVLMLTQGVVGNRDINLEVSKLYDMDCRPSDLSPKLMNLGVVDIMGD
jgi:hypothetical protein